MAEPLVGGSGGGQEPPKAHSILWIFCCQTMHYFVYLARLHEPLAKRVKNLVSAAKSLRTEGLLLRYLHAMFISFKKSA